MPETQTVETVYGQVEIETVDCDSCGTTIAKEDAYPFEVKRRVGNVSAGTLKDGYACEYCAEEGLSGFPERVREWIIPGSDRLPLHVAFAVAPVALSIMTFEGFRGSDDFAEGYATAAVTLVGWALALGVLAYYGGAF